MLCSGSEAQPGDSQLVVSMEQALPVRSEWLNFNRLRIRGERTVPLGPYKLLLCGKGASARDSACPACCVGPCPCPIAHGISRLELASASIPAKYVP
jgi:hypothetical protein